MNQNILALLLPFFLVNIGFSAPVRSRPEILLSELKKYSVFEDTKRICALQISQSDYTKRAFLHGRTLGFNALEIAPERFEFRRPSNLPEYFESILVKNYPVNSPGGLKGPKVKARLILNTKNKTIVGIGVFSFAGLTEKGNDSWFYDACGLTTYDQLKDLNPDCTCNCSE
jgi:hypothetical protein